MGNIAVLLDVAIGMIVIYILGALLVSSLQEVVASILQWRAKHLKESILQLMLSEEVNDVTLKQAEEIRENIYKNPLVQSMNHVSFSRLVTWNILNPLLTLNFSRLSKNLKFIINFKGKKSQIYQKLYSTSDPSYLEPENFATVILQELSKGGEMPSQRIEDFKKKIQDSQKLPKSLKETLVSLADRAAIKVKKEENEILAFEKEIEDWFNRSMERASGVYKRNSQIFCFILGLILAVTLNLDSLEIYNKLIQDSSLRTALANSAEVIVKNSQTNGKLDQSKLQANISTITGNYLPINLINRQASNLVDCTANQPSNCTLNPGKFVQAAIGWLITTIAIYMGAPFWFELLGKLVNVRATGSKPKS